MGYQRDVHRVLCSMPGRAGDIAWALPTVRAISEHFGVRVDLQTTEEFAPMVDLLLQQPYLAGVISDPRWSMSDGWEAPRLPQEYDRIFHLGFRRWPELPLPLEVYHTVTAGEYWQPLPPLDLHRPWITVKGVAPRAGRVAVGFTEAWFELKLGLLLSVNHQVPETLLQLTPQGSRWETELPSLLAPVLACDWVTAAQAIAASTAFLGDCSALHVLAVAMGRPAVVVEPMPERLNPIFWALGMHGPQVYCVMGNDGKPSFDARHTADLLQQVLHGR